jgi:hypothetical protein
MFAALAFSATLPGLKNRPPEPMRLMNVAPFKSTAPSAWNPPDSQTGPSIRLALRNSAGFSAD